MPLHNKRTSVKAGKVHSEPKPSFARKMHHSKNDGNMSKGHRSQTDETPTSQIRDNVNLKINASHGL